MIISPGRGYIFIHIPKTGGTSLATALEARAKADDILIGDTPKAVKRRKRLKHLQAPGRLWKHSRLSDIDGMPELPDPAFLFTLVRNPWDRVASLYHWSRRQGFDHPIIDAAKELTFDGFLAEPSVQAALRHDTAQSYLTDRAGQLRCDAFIRLEHWHTDIAPLEDHLGFRIDLPHVNASDHPGTSALYTHTTRDIVADLLADDIARFGYEFPA